MAEEKQIKFKGARVINKHETEANWLKSTFVPLQAEIVVYDIDETHTEPRFKIGDGIRNVNELPFVTSADVTIAANGAVIFGDENEALTRNAFVVGEENMAGSYGFVIQRCDRAEGATAGTYTLDDTTGLVVGDIYSVIVGGNYEDEGTITAINGNIVTVDPVHVFDPTISNDGFTLKEEYIASGYQPIFRIIRKPAIGTTLVGEGAFVSGGRNKAEMIYSSAEGFNNIAGGKYSHVEGQGNVAGYASHAEGNSNLAVGHAAHAEGSTNKVYGWNAHAEGQENEITRDAKAAHVEGYKNKVESFQGHAEGRENLITAENGHVEGYKNAAAGINAHVEGERNTSAGRNSHIEGQDNKGGAANEHIEGTNNIAFIEAEDLRMEKIVDCPSITEFGQEVDGVHFYFGNNFLLPNGEYLVINGDGTRICRIGIKGSEQNPMTYEYYNIVEILEELADYRIEAIGKREDYIGRYVVCENGSSRLVVEEQRAGINNHIEGANNFVLGHHTHVEGVGNSIAANTAHTHVEGRNHANIAGNTNHIEGLSNTIHGTANHIEGTNNVIGTSGASFNHIEGDNNQITNSIVGGHIEGRKNTLSGSDGHIEGYSNNVTAARGHAEGASNTVSGVSGHAEGEWNQATGYKSHAGGFDSRATGENSFAHGNRFDSKTHTQATGLDAIAMGKGAWASGEASVALGVNIRANGYGQVAVGKHNAPSADYMFVVGNGEDKENLSNAFVVKKDGSAEVQAVGNDDNAVVNKKYVEENIPYAHQYLHEVSTVKEALDWFANNEPTLAQVSQEAIRSNDVDLYTSSEGWYGQLSVPRTDCVINYVTDCTSNQILNTQKVNNISECTNKNLLYTLPNGRVMAYINDIPKLDIQYEVKNNSRWEATGLKSTGRDGYIALNTNIIPVKENEVYEVYGIGTWAVYGYWLSSNETPTTANIVATMTDPKENSGANKTKHFTVPFVADETNPKENKIKYAMFTSYVMPGWSSVPSLKVTPLTPTLDWHETGYSFNTEQTGDMLRGKKYVACGDSFSAITSQVSKPYPQIIAERNNMELINLAISGSTIVNTGNEEDNKPFSNNRYYAIPKDTDYITLMFGLNETEKVKHGQITIGTPEDTDNTTLWGAYNEVLGYIITNIPDAKVGIILADSWMTEQYANIVKEICKYWGVAYLDLKGDNVPLGITNDYNVTLTPAQAARNKQFKVSDTNGHPNQNAHNFRSTIIENFLRSL